MADEKISPIIFPLYYDRWTAATRHLTAAARGVYLDWLGWTWNRDKPLPLDAGVRARIAAVTLEELARLWPELSEFWHETPTGYINHSLERKRTEHRDFHASQREKGIKGAAVRWGKNSPATTPAINRGNSPANAPPMASDLGSRSSDLDLGSRNSDLENQKQDQEHSLREKLLSKVNGHKEKTKNPKALGALAIQVRFEKKGESEAEIKAELTDRAAKAGIDYDATSIAVALDVSERIVRLKSV